VTSGVRFSAGYARVRALKSRLWTSLDRELVLRAGVEPDGRALSGDPDAVFPPLVRWYAIVLRMYPAARPLVTWMLRLHEIENLKLLWRAALRGRPPMRACWRPLEPLGTVTFESRASLPEALVHRLSRTPYGAIARTLLRSHAADLPAAEIGLDRWAWTGLFDEAAALPPREAAALRLVRLLILEHDLDLLRRGTSFGLAADLVAKSTVVLSREGRIATLARTASWRPGEGPLARVLPPAVLRLSAGAAGWDDVLRDVRQARLRACRRAFVGWPFELAPPVAVLMLRDAQSRAAMSLAAARGAGGEAHAVLPVALAASELEF
jgi:hypothetical protein